MTKYLQFNDEDLHIAGEIVRKGGLVAFPTETVYGLGANALDPEAVKSIYVAKGRPSDNPLIVHIYDKSQLNEIASHVSEDAEKVVSTLMPGSITVVFPKKSVIDDCVTGGLNTVAVRMPSSKEALAFLNSCNVPVAAPSANTSTRPSPTTWQAVKEDMDGRIDALLMGSDCKVGIESTVLDLTGDEPLVLRPGIVTPKEISQVLGKPVRVVTNPKEKVNSPGVRYKHYAPRCPMVLNLDGNRDKIRSFYDKCVKDGYNPVVLTRHPEGYPECNTCFLGGTDREVAHNLFELLRKCEKQYDYIIASYNGDDEVAFSILNRITKSAGQNIL